MRTLSWFTFSVLLALTGLIDSAYAANTPCSGRKGGIDHCSHGQFVCKDGSISASKKVCNAPGAAAPSA